ncbi:cytochrome-c peroxidase [Sphingobacterium thalpophilum]|uniref:Cytochrome c551 peroxidase n=1 Tax=Sphingobacterium thalpophilum TaxID=259 RepID=A0A4U9UXY8_9SPHI|nr:cytochrome c peroxidase [Sphingobacterium thalpophilum]VTR35114.1 Cytochrome c551 peroxidase precursor [Sphingobacterium thalpophilum]
MKKVLLILSILWLLLSCNKEDDIEPMPYDNPEIPLEMPQGFPAVNSSLSKNKPTEYGVQLGEKLFHEKKFSGNNTISCASCHRQSNAFADNNAQAIGIYGRIGLRNTPPIQNLVFMKSYNWDGSKLTLESQPLVPIITHEEMNSSILEVIGKLKVEHDYKELFRKTFGDEDITPDRIYRSLSQYQYTLISANSKYDKVIRNEGEIFTESEARGYHTFKMKCASCHSTELFTDQSFRNVGFPLNPSTEEAGRARVTGIPADFMNFRVPSLRNAEYTAPYGSFGQFPTLRAVLDYFDNGVLDADNLDPILKENGNRIPLSEQEKQDIINFIKTLSDSKFVGK